MNSYISEVDQILSKAQKLETINEARKQQIDISKKQMVDQISEYLINLMDPFMDEKGQFKIQIWGSYISTWKNSSDWNVAVGGNDHGIDFRFTGRKLLQIAHYRKDYNVSEEDYPSCAERWQYIKKDINESIEDSLMKFNENQEKVFKENEDCYNKVVNFQI